MRRRLSLILAIGSLIGGALVALPRVHDRLWKPQILLSELPWIPGYMGVFAILLRPFYWVSNLIALVGIWFAMLPLWDLRWTIRTMERAMRNALGEEYEEAIPDVVLEQMSQRHWSWRRMLGFSGLSKRRTEIIEDVVYKQTVERDLKLDIYCPKSEPLIGETYPAVIVVHGGSWRSGDKGGLFTPQHRHLTQQGYVVFDIQYRFSQEVLWDEPMRDVQDAIRWVKAHAEDYRIDPNRLALIGRSAGGHLALHAAYRVHEDETTAVKAVIGAYPPTELRLWWTIEDTAITDLLGGLHHEMSARWQDASVVELVRDGLPPTMLMQGYKDSVVRPAHVEWLANGLQLTDTPTVVLRLPWSRHGFDALYRGLGAQMVQYELDRFLAFYLYGDAYGKQQTSNSQETSLA